MLQGITRGFAPHGDARLYQTRNKTPSTSYLVYHDATGVTILEVKPLTSVPLEEEDIRFGEPTQKPSPR